MKHVFVETNWVVDYCAPAHRRVLAAVKLLEDANSGKINLYLPAPCLTEARFAIRTKFQPNEANRLREFLKWAKTEGHLEAAQVESTRQVLDQFERLVKQDLDNLEVRLERLKGEKGLEIFPLNTQMLEKSVSLATEVELKPFDNSILAAILIRSDDLRNEGETDLAFCELDGDLQPWDKNGNNKPVLTRLYDEARVWVYGDFTLTTPERRADW
jgi:predicted nucleic acid-binding protein